MFDKVAILEYSNRHEASVREDIKGLPSIKRLIIDYANNNSHTVYMVFSKPGSIDQKSLKKQAGVKYSMRYYETHVALRMYISTTYRIMARVDFSNFPVKKAFFDLRKQGHDIRAVSLIGVSTNKTVFEIRVGDAEQRQKLRDMIGSSLVCVGTDVKLHFLGN